METSFLLLPMIFSLVNGLPADTSTNTRQEYNDTDSAPSGILQTLATLPFLPSGNNDLSDLTSFPYESYHDIGNSYGPPPEPQPSFGVSVNTQAILAPQVEVTRFLEAFLRLKSELLARLQSLLNDNWDLGRALLNVLIGKVQKLISFLMKGVGLLRNFLEFVLNLFSSWSLTLPSLTLGGSATSRPQPHAVYGVPPSAAASPSTFST